MKSSSFDSGGDGEHNFVGSVVISVLQYKTI